MSKLVEALKRKFRTPEEVVQVLGIDPLLAQDESPEELARTRGTLTEAERAAASQHVQHREDMPEGAFLEPASRKYPVKTKRDGAWHYDRDLLLAAEREALMHEHPAIAERAKAIREREFPGAADSAISNQRSMNMGKLSPHVARAVGDVLKRRGLLAMDASPEEVERVVTELEDPERREGADARARRAADARARAVDAKRRAADARKRASDARARGDARSAMDAESEADEADLDADRWEDAEADDIEPNSGLPIYIEEEEEEPEVGADELACRDMRDRRAHDARAKLGRDETPEEMRTREEREAAADARAKLGRDETPEEMRVRGAKDRMVRDTMRARDAFRKARDSRRRAADEVRRHAADMRRAEDDMRRAASDRRHATDAKNADDARRAEDAMRRAKDARRAARDARRHAVDVLKRAHDSILTTGMDLRRAADSRRAARDAREETGMTRSEVEDALHARDREHAHAMDEAIKRERERSTGFQRALSTVRPYVGELAMDSASCADDVFRTSLRMLGVSTENVHPSAYPEMFKLAAQARSAGQTRGVSPTFALDSSVHGNAPSFESMFPDAARIGHN